MRILVTGATGVVGSDVVTALGRGHEVVTTSRSAGIPWHIGAEPAPDALRGRWDAIVHTSASTRWTMTREEAYAANISTTRAVLDLAGPDTHVVHVSTAYAGHGGTVGGPFDGYRNGYEWSKARCEELVTDRDGPATIVRPPLVLGARDTGRITRFSGPYTLLQALSSGLAAVVVGEPGGYAEIAPVDQVAEVVAQAALGAPPTGVRTQTIAAGAHCLRLSQLVDHLLAALNEWRDGRGLPPVPVPPTLSMDRWHRFYLPLARTHLSPVQNEAVSRLGMFEAYTSMAAPFEPTHPVVDPAGVLTRSVRYWAATKPRLASRLPQPWALVGA